MLGVITVCSIDSCRTSSASLYVALAAQRPQSDAGVRTGVAVRISLFREWAGTGEKDESERVLVAVSLMAGHAIGREIGGRGRPD